MYYLTKATPIDLPPKMRCIQKPTLPAMMKPQNFQQHSTSDFLHSSIQHCGDQYHGNNPFLMGPSDVTLSTTMPTELIDQMMNCSHQHSRFRPPTNPFDDIPASNQSFYERNLKFQQQQQYQARKRDFYNSAGFSTGCSSSSSSLSAYEANLQQQYSAMSPTASFYGRFEPPKPDTPPSKPLWLDPVWHCDSNFFKNRTNVSGANVGNSESVRKSNYTRHL